MSIKDSVFGELEYDYVWSKDIIVNFGDKEVEISLMVDGDEDGEFEEEQYIAYESLMKRWNNINTMIMKSILDYYKEKREELGYDIEKNERYPLIENEQELSENVSLVGIYVPYSGTYDGREVGLTFDCTWDDENGIGLLLVNENVVEVGYQDIVM